MTTGQHLIGGRYELGELLGRGGMAEVRKGTDTRLGRVVAIKRLRTDLASDATFQARFRREAQSSASLNHPADRRGLRHRRGAVHGRLGRRPALHRHGVRRRPDAARDPPRGPQDPARAGAGDHQRRAVRARLQPPGRHHPPRHQAGERDAHPERRREGDGLRHRPRDLRRLLDDDPDRGRGRHRAVPLARAGPRRDRRLPLRRLLRRLPALRAAHRSAAVRRRQPGCRGLPARARAGAAAVQPRHRPPGRGRRDRDEEPGQAGRGPLPVGRRHAQRHRALPRRPTRPRRGPPGASGRARPDPRPHGDRRSAPPSPRRSSGAAGPRCTCCSPSSSSR